MRHSLSMEEDAQDEPTLRDGLSAVSVCNAALQTLDLHRGGLEEDMVHVRQDIRKINERVKAAGVRGRINALQSNVHDMAALLNKVNDLENRSVRNNVWIVGVTDNAAGRNPVTVFESWLLNIVGKVIERAQMVPTRPQEPPCLIRIKLLHFRDPDSTLRERRKTWILMATKSPLPGLH